MLLPINFRETEITLQSNPNIRALMSIPEEELPKPRLIIPNPPAPAAITKNESNPFATGLPFQEEGFTMLHSLVSPVFSFARRHLLPGIFSPSDTLPRRFRRRFRSDNRHDAPMRRTKKKTPPGRRFLSRATESAPKKPDMPFLLPPTNPKLPGHPGIHFETLEPRLLLSGDAPFFYDATAADSAFDLTLRLTEEDGAIVQLVDNEATRQEGGPAIIARRPLDDTDQQIVIIGSAFDDRLTLDLDGGLGGELGGLLVSFPGGGDSDTDILTVSSVDSGFSGLTVEAERIVIDAAMDPAAMDGITLKMPGQDGKTINDIVLPPETDAPVMVGLAQLADGMAAARAEVANWPLGNRHLDVIDQSLTEWLPLEALFTMGDYLAHYLHPVLEPDVPLTGGDPIPAGDYSTDGIPTWEGFSDYLDTHWFGGDLAEAGFIGESGEGPLTIDYAGDVLTLSYAGTLTHTDSMAPAMEKELESLGVSLDDKPDELTVTTELDVALSLMVDTSSAAPRTEFRLDVNATGTAEDIALGGRMGSLALELGDAEKGYGSIHLDLHGNISLTDGKLAFNFEPFTDAEGNVKSSNRIEVVLPVYASLNGKNLAAPDAGVPRLLLTGGLVPEAGNPLKFTTENLQHLLDFGNFDAEGAIGTFPVIGKWLSELAGESELLTGEIPFLADVTVGDALAFGTAFTEQLVSPVSFGGVEGIVEVLKTEEVIAHANEARFDTETKRLTVSGLETFSDDLAQELANTLVAGGKITSAGQVVFDTGTKTLTIDNVERLTLSRFVDALVTGGVLTGADLTFDAEARTLTIPLAFTVTAQPVRVPRDTDGDGEPEDANPLLALAGLRLPTGPLADVRADSGPDPEADAAVDLSAGYRGSLELVLDFDGESGEDAMAFFVDNLTLAGDLDFARDLDLAARLGMVGIAAAGAVGLDATANLALKETGPDGEPDRTRFALDELAYLMEADSVLANTFTGTANATLSDLQVNAGFGGLSFGAEDTVQITIPDLTAPHTAQVSLPALTGFDVTALDRKDLFEFLDQSVLMLRDLLRSQPGYTETLPLIDQSPEAIFGFIEEIQQAVDAVRIDTTVNTFQAVEAALESALSLTDDNALAPEAQQFSLFLEGEDILRLRFAPDWSIQTSVDLALDMAAISHAAGVDAEAAILDGATALTNAAAGGELQFTGFVTGALEAGADFGNLLDGDPDNDTLDIFLEDYDAADGSGTSLTAGFRVLGADVDTRLGMGDLALAVTGGRVTIDGDGDPTTDDFVTLTAAIYDDTPPADDDGQNDHKFHWFSEAFDANLHGSLAGGYDVALPVTLDAFGTTSALDAPLAVSGAIHNTGITVDSFTYPNLDTLLAPELLSAATKTAIRSAMTELAATIAGHKAPLLAGIDRDASIPGLDLTLDDLFGEGGLDAVFALDTWITDYVAGYDFDHWNRLDFTAGLLDALEQDWLAGLPGLADALNSATPDVLTLTFTDSGFHVVFDAVGAYDLNGQSLDLADEFAAAGVTVTGEAGLDPVVETALAFDFDFTDFTFRASANEQDLILDAAVGPLAVSAGREGEENEQTTLAMNLAGHLYTDEAGALALESLPSTLDLTLPLYATLAGKELSDPAALPTVRIAGDPLAGSLTVSPEHLETLRGSFQNFDMGMALSLIPGALDWLSGVLAGTEIGELPVPFVPDMTIASSLDFAAGFSAGLDAKVGLGNIHTLGGFIAAIELAGVLPEGMSIDFDIAEQTPRIPLAFNMPLTARLLPVELDLGLGDRGIEFDGAAPAGDASIKASNTPFPASIIAALAMAPRSRPQIP
uniref:Ca2+-binding protein, RTX toxin-related n=1 Tax=Candidatus Kentrum sp. DK TaxID=2126562 RepID=A0A450TIA2_9GAMM|nr:MAG: hypothetical protein BECKDK2373B_GA0170837_11802 [Candidatus Kentron sp. DK]